MFMRATLRTPAVTAAAVVALAGAMQFPGEAAQQTPAGCRVTGRVTSLVTAPAPPFGGRGRFGAPPGAVAPPGSSTRQGQAGAAGAAAPAEPAAPAPPATIALPVSGATILVHQGTKLVVATAADTDGRFSILFTPGQTFAVTAEMAAFQSQQKELTLGALPCDTKLDFDLALVPRDRSVADAGATGAPGTASAPTGRFTQLAVRSDPAGAAALDVTPLDQSAELARLLPPGFTLQSASADAVSVTARGDAINVDRGILNDRMSAIGRGEFDPATGQFAAGFAPLTPEEGFGQGGGRGGLNGGGGRGGQGGPGGFALGGRGGRGQSLYQGSANYSFGGSGLDSTNFQPRNGIVTPVSAQPYARNNFGGTIGGPVIIPGLYKDTNRRTSFQLNYSGNHSTSLQDQYLTVPSIAMRNGDFSKSTIQLVNPATGQPFTDNQIPSTQYSPTALALMDYIPEPNVPGAITQNFHTAATTLSSSNSVSLRINQNLTPTIPQRGAGPGGRGGGGGGRGGGAPGGGGQGRGGRGLTINLSAQLQYRENTGEQFNVIPQLASKTKATAITVPINLTVAKGRTNNTFAVNVTSNRSTTSNLFSNTVDVAGVAGISYPSPQEPLNWGVPNLTFSNFNVRLNPANSRDDLRTSVSYTLSRPVRKPPASLRHGVPARQLLEPEQRQCPGHVHLHGPLLQQWRAHLADDGRGLRGLLARPAPAGYVAGGRSQDASAESVCRVSGRQLAAQQPDDV
jgi:hypothetical protein